MHRDKHSTGSRSGPREALLPILWRRLSTLYYRRSERFGRHRAKVGDDRVLPLPPLEDELTVYFLDRLPIWCLGQDPINGSRRYARLAAACCSFVAKLIGLVFVVLRSIMRLVRRSPIDSNHFLKRPPIGNVQVDLGPVRLWGFETAADSLTCYWQRVGVVDHRCQIFVHLFPMTSEHKPLRHLSKDHDPICAIRDWPRRRVFVDQVCLDDIEPGTYRIEVGIIDYAIRERFLIAENNSTVVDLGWFDLKQDTISQIEPPKEVKVASA